MINLFPWARRAQRRQQALAAAGDHQAAEHDAAVHRLIMRGCPYCPIGTTSMTADFMIRHLQTFHTSPISGPVT